MINDFFNKNLIFNNDSIICDMGRPELSTIMMSWEHPIMKKHAEIVCHNQGDILEVGFGMGISATYIQQFKPKSHTIIEGHPQILEKLYEWSKNNNNVKIIEGDWIYTSDKLETYDGIFFDTYAENNTNKIYDTFFNKLKIGGIFTMFNNHQCEYNDLKKPCEYEIIDLSDIKDRTYFKEKFYYVPIFKKSLAR